MARASSRAATPLSSALALSTFASCARFRICIFHAGVVVLLFSPEGHCLKRGRMVWTILRSHVIVVTRLIE